MKSIRKFNLYCEKLEELYDPASNISLLPPLPTKLAELHDDSALMEDVWITSSDEKPPAWLEDSDIRGGIHALMKLDWCLEEQRCLEMESDKLLVREGAWCS
jgi:hypothetical protein